MAVNKINVDTLYFFNTARPTGDTISMLDAMKYNNLLCVQTNVGYSVVAEFIRQNSLCKRNQLKICRGTSSWNPSFLMTYYSEPELLAIEQVFPSTKSFLL